jgi:tetratricopeptide (TPR) repeat protein
MIKIILLALLIIVAFGGQVISQTDLVQNNTSKVIIDKREEVTIRTAQPLLLSEGYKLAVVYVSEDGKKIAVKLTKGPKLVSQMTVSLSDQTKQHERGLYRYQKNIGNTNITLIEVHFKNAAREMDWDEATVDRIWQISEPKPPAIWQNETNASAANATVSSMPSLAKLSDQEWFDKAFALDDSGKYEEAIQAYEEALKQNPQMIGAWIDKGLDLERLGRHEEAIQSYEAALQINPKHEGAWYSKGVSLLNSKQYNESISAFEQALQLKPR